jgi:metal-responsive CopG/Arc/MetJ family transcriptional regulator
MIKDHTNGGIIMNSSKIAITIESGMLAEVDVLVKKHLFPNRSRAIQEAIKEKLSRLNHSLLAQECAKLEPEYEQTMAEEGFTEDMSEWPEY